jgi:two-component system response regulator
MNVERTDTPGGEPEGAILPPMPGPTLLVLHVNDSTDDQVLFQTACKHAGAPFAWHVTDSAEKAMSYLQTLVKVDRLHAVRWPDLVVLDIIMPGENGLKVLEFIRTTPELQRLPVVIFTGHASPALLAEAYKLGANSFLAKPEDFKEAVSLVASLYSVWSAAKRPTM